MISPSQLDGGFSDFSLTDCAKYIDTAASATPLFAHVRPLIMPQPFAVAPPAGKACSTGMAHTTSARGFPTKKKLA